MIFQKAADVLWGDWLLFALLGLGIFYTIMTGGIQFRCLPLIVRGVFKGGRKNTENDEGKNCSSYQALCAAIASCVGSGNIVIYGTGMNFHLFRKLQMADQIRDMSRRSMVMMAMLVMVPMFMVMIMFIMMTVFMILLMIMAVPAVRSLLPLFFSIYGHRHMGSGDSAGLSRMSFDSHSRKPQSVHRVKKSLLIFQKFIQGGRIDLISSTQIFLFSTIIKI